MSLGRRHCSAVHGSTLILIALMLVSCTNGRDVGFEMDEGDTGGDPTSTSIREGDSGRSTRTPATTRTRPPPSAGSAGESPPSSEEAQEPDGSLGGPGQFARTLLRPKPATTVVFERLEQSGAAPRPATIDHARSVLRAVTGKAVADPPPIGVPGGAQEWSAQDIRDTADRLTGTQQGGGRAVLRALFLRGNLEGRDDVLGVAVRGDVLAIFSDAVAAAGTPLISGGAIEDAVLIHEIGHLLGLVDLARNTGRADPERPGHSRNRDSVMHWAVESSLVAQVLTGGPPRDFDRQDLADLAALRNGA